MTIDSRISAVERDSRDHAKTISELINNDTRRQDAEEARVELEELKEKHLNERLDRIEARITAVYSLGKWLLVSAGSTLLLAVVTFIIKGGLFA